MKHNYRKEGLKQRRKIDLIDKKKRDDLIFNQVMGYIDGVSSVGIYISLEDEVDTHRIIQYLFDNNVKVIVPKTHEKTLEFFEIDSFQQVAKGNFEVLEPIAGVKQEELKADIWIIPIVAFNRNRQRIGYGKGYYDSALYQATGLKIGLAYDCQEVGIFEKENQDVDMDIILTGTRIIN